MDELDQIEAALKHYQDTDDSTYRIRQLQDYRSDNYRGVDKNSLARQTLSLLPAIRKQFEDMEAENKACNEEIAALETEKEQLEEENTALKNQLQGKLQLLHDGIVTKQWEKTGYSSLEEWILEFIKQTIKPKE